MHGWEPVLPLITEYTVGFGFMFGSARGIAGCVLRDQMISDELRFKRTF